MNFAVALGMVLLLRRSLAAGAAPASAKPILPITPYRAFAWIAPASPLPHLVPLVRYQSSSDPVVVAAALRNLPVGERFLLRWESNDNRFWHNPGDELAIPKSAATRPADLRPCQGPWADHGAAAEGAFESRFASQLQQRGGDPDLLVLDTEMGIDTQSLTAPQLSAILVERRWPALARRWGVGSTATLVHAVNTPSAEAFNLAMQVTTGRYIRAAYFEPWRKYFPALGCSDFGDGVLDAAQARQAIDDDGNIQPMALSMHGTVQSPCCYAWVHGLARSPSNQGADFSQPMPVLCWIVSMVRAYAQSPQPIVPWIAAKSWTDGHVPLAGSPYQDELLWHVCLSAGCTDVLLFNPDSPAADNVAMDGDLAALAEQAGDAPALAPLSAAAVPFRSAVLVSGARCAGGQRVYRITVARASPQPQSVKVMLSGQPTPTMVIIPANQIGAWVVQDSPAK